MRVCYTLFIVTLLVFSGCVHQTIGSYEKDLSHKTEVWGGFDPLSIYETKEAVFLRRKDDIMSSRIIAIEIYQKPDYGLKLEILDQYPSLEQYNRCSQNWPDIIGVLPAGSHIQCKKVIERGAWLWGKHLIYIGTIIKGCYLGLEIDISALCLNYDCKRSPITKRPNPKVLKEIDNGDEWPLQN